MRSNLLVDADSIILFSCTGEAFDGNHTSSSYENVCEDVLSELWCPTCKCTDTQSKVGHYDINTKGERGIPNNCL